MRNGARNVVASIQRFQDTGQKDSLQQSIRAWVEIAQVFAELTQRRGQEFFDEKTGQRYSQSIFSFTFKYFDVQGVTSKDRLVVEDQNYDIRAIFPDLGKKTQTRIDATIQDATA